jgi:RNA polymerase sigma factor (TIGR02999 family)
MERDSTDRESGEVTRLLEAVKQEGQLAENSLMELVYDELHRLARSRLSHEARAPTLNPTALVNEAWLRLQSKPEFSNRRHFFGAAAEAMRRVLVDRARAHKRLKRGEGQAPLDLALIDPPWDPPGLDILALDEALARLAAESPQKAHLVELRYFAGLTYEEAANTLGISRATAERWWAYARAFLYAELHDAGEAGHA